MRLTFVRVALTPRRALAAGVALLCVAVQGASVTHLALTRHAVCPEHGELVHTGFAERHTSAQPHAGRPVAGLAITAPHDSDAAHHRDEHCAVLASRREHALLAAPVRELQSPAVAKTAAAPPRAAALTQARARYDVAPKQGPPA